MATQKEIRCKDGLTVTQWYDYHTRSFVTQWKDQAGTQVGDADYDGSKESAAFTLDQFIRCAGGRI